MEQYPLISAVVLDLFPDRCHLCIYHTDGARTYPFIGEHGSSSGIDAAIAYASDRVRRIVVRRGSRNLGAWHQRNTGCPADLRPVLDLDPQQRQQRRQERHWTEQLTR